MASGLKPYIPDHVVNTHADFGPYMVAVQGSEALERHMRLAASRVVQIVDL